LRISFTYFGTFKTIYRIKTRVACTFYGGQ